MRKLKYRNAKCLPKLCFFKVYFFIFIKGQKVHFSVGLKFRL